MRQQTRVILMVTLAISIMLRVLASPGAGAVNCCQYALVQSDIQPSPGERVQFTGIVTDQYGVGEPGVQIQYHDSAPTYQPLIQDQVTDPRGLFNVVFTIDQFTSTSSASYTISMNDPVSGWHQTVGGSYSVNTGPSSQDVPVLYDSQGVGGLLGAYIKLQSPTLPAIIFISGGYEVSFLHGVNQLDQGTISFLDYFANNGFNVVAPIGWVAPDVPSFPLVIGALLKYGFLIDRVYLIGWSAGGTAAAWALTHDFHGLFNLAVIMDAELNGPSESSTHTEYSVFTSAQFASQVSIPHLLIWGRDNSDAISIQSATGWVKNAKVGLSRLDPFSYSHTWVGTSIEPTIRRDMSEFFNTQAVGYANLIDANQGNVSIPARILTNSQINNATYNPANQTFTIVTTGQPGTVGVINMVVPKAALDGQPVVTMDGAPLDSSYAEDGDKYYLYFTYTQSTHTFSISGQNTVPEFPAYPMLQHLTLLASLVSILILRRRRY